MHICKSPRRKIARKCIFCAGVPAYARIKAGATAQKVIARAIIFLRGETLPKCPALPCSTFGGNPPAGKGRAEVQKKMHICKLSRRKMCVLVRFVDF